MYGPPLSVLSIFCGCPFQICWITLLLLSFFTGSIWYVRASLLFFFITHFFFSDRFFCARGGRWKRENMDSLRSFYFIWSTKRTQFGILSWPKGKKEALSRQSKQTNKRRQQPKLDWWTKHGPLTLYFSRIFFFTFSYSCLHEPLLQPLRVTWYRYQDCCCRPWSQGG